VGLSLRVQAATLVHTQLWQHLAHWPLVCGYTAAAVMVHTAPRAGLHSSGSSSGGGQESEARFSRRKVPHPQCF